MNLVELSLFIKRGIVILFALIFLYLAFIFLRPIIQETYISLFPPPNPPTIKWGKLDALKFLEKPISGDIGAITLNTASGRLPVGLPDRMSVYLFKKIPYSYQAARNAQSNAATLGFTDDELVTDLKGDEFSWRDQQTGGSLTIQINTSQLELTTPLGTKDDIYPQGRLIIRDVRESTQDLLRSIGRFNDPLYNVNDAIVTFGKIENGELIKANSQFEAQIARIDFFRKINNFKIVGEDPTRGLINMQMGSYDGRETPPRNVRFPNIEYNAWDIESSDASATYPIITVQEAWNAVAVEKNGVIAQVTPKENSVFSSHIPVKIDEVFINDIYLAYYDTKEQQNFLQPIYVFDGDYNVDDRAGGSITLYFPAIQGQYVNPPVEEDN